MVSGKAEEAEKQRRKRLHVQLAGPKSLVEAPVAIVRQQLADLPAGVSLESGRIVLEGFLTIEQAQQQILALIMALGNDQEGFAELVTVE
jgi:hypothetical protein